MADAQGGTGSPAIVDQSVGELNSKLSEVVDNALGFGCLEGQIKGKLVKLRDPVPFCDYLSHDATFDSVESTSSSKDAVRLKQMVQLAGIEGDYGVESGFSSFIQTFRDQRVVFFFFRRVIAKRSIPVPKFSTLIPVRQGAHLEDGRWIVEQFGNQVCTDEFYGGLANVAFSWDHSARMTASKLISGVQAAMAKGDLKKEFLQMCKTNQINCRANVKGFSLPFTIEGTLTTTSGVMNLIESLNQLPIKCAVPVGTSSVRIQFTGGFPPTIYVETKIRDIKTQEKLMALLQRLRGTERDIPALCELVERLGEEIENAEFNDRAVLHDLRELASSVAQTLIHHGKRVELYERYGEHRLHTENCDSNGVTSSATETLFTLTLGVAIPVVRSYQREWFNNAEKWTAPEHYKTTQIGSTNAVSGYYDRVKLQLLFNDEELVKTWRDQMDGLLASRPRARRGTGFAWNFFGARSA